MNIITVCEGRFKEREREREREEEARNDKTRQ